VSLATLWSGLADALDARESRGGGQGKGGFVGAIDVVKAVGVGRVGVRVDEALGGGAKG